MAYITVREDQSIAQLLVDRYNKALWKNHPGLMESLLDKTDFISYVTLVFGISKVKPVYAENGAIHTRRTIDAVLDHATKSATDGAELTPHYAARISPYFAPLEVVLSYAKAHDLNETHRQIADLYLKGNISQAMKLVSGELPAKQKKMMQAAENIREVRYLYAKLELFSRESNADKQLLKPLGERLSYWMFFDKYCFDNLRSLGAHHDPIFTDLPLLYADRNNLEQAKQIAMNEFGISEIKAIEITKQARIDADKRTIWDGQRVSD